MLNKVRQYIDRQHLLDSNRQHLVALSGGADSVCLLLMMRQLGYDVHAVHCNFHLRGEESNRDEQFCVDLCSRLGITLHRTHFDTLTYSEVHKVSIELAARELRYGYFEQLRLSLGAEDILVAHHRDDNVETVIMNLVRGTGLRGLQGIHPRNGHVVRPLLCLSRRDIIDYLALQHQPFVTDSTNLVDDVTRNSIRLNVVPLLETLNPSASANIDDASHHLAEAGRIVEAALRQSRQRVMPVEGTISVAALMKEVSPSYVLFSILGDYGFSSAQSAGIFASITAQSGRAWQSPTHTVATDRGTLVIAGNEAVAPQPTMVIPECGIYIYNERARVRVTQSDRDDTFTPSREQWRVTLDADRVTFPLTVRPIQQGDRFRPFGMRGTKLVSDYLTDRKRNYFQRHRQLVLADADGTILWLMGERTAQPAACHERTTHVLTIEMEETERL